MKVAELCLPYWKQGDDMALYLQDCDSVGEALELHARNMDLAADMLRRLKEEIAGHDIHIDAGTHMIFIEGEDEIINRLEELDLVEIRPPHPEDEGIDAQPIADKEWPNDGF